MFQQPQQSRFDWASAIAINRDALIAVVAAIFRMLKIKGDDAPERMARPLHRRALRLLTPAESACRRLIVIAARGLVAKPLPVAQSRAPGVSAKSANAGPAPGRSRPPAFKLFDPRKCFPQLVQSGHGRKLRPPPRITVLDWGYDPRVPAFLGFRPEPAPAPPPPPPEDDGLINAQPLCRRLRALKAALDDVPHQAQRLVRWRARRERQRARRPVFVTPLRPGLPPGYRTKPVHQVDHVLIECHDVALDAMRRDTS
jgi:hypothetical protein